MIYRQGHDKAGDNLHFPFPIRLVQYNNGIGLTVVGLPNDTELRTLLNQGRLYLCLEVAVTARYYRTHGSNNRKHPCKGGKFIVRGLDFGEYPENTCPYVYQLTPLDLQDGEEITFPIDENLLSTVRKKLKYKNVDYFIKVRGALRKKEIDARLDRITNYRLVSNVAKIPISV